MIECCVSFCLLYLHVPLCVGIEFKSHSQKADFSCNRKNNSIENQLRNAKHFAVASNKEIYQEKQNMK